MKKTYFEIEQKLIYKNGSVDYKYLEQQYDSKDKAISSCEWEITMDRRNNAKARNVKDIEYSVNEIVYDEEADSYEYPSSVLVGKYEEE